MAAPNPRTDPRRILVRGVNWLGDAVMTLPSLTRLRERFPGASITLLTHAKLEDFWRGQTVVDQVIPFAKGESLWGVAGRLREQNFNLALVLPNSPRSALEAWLARIPERVGYGRSGRNWFLTQVVASRPDRVQMKKRTPAEIRELIKAPGVSAAPPPGAHQIHEYLHLVAALGASPVPVAPSLRVADQELATARTTFLDEWLKSRGIGDAQNPAMLLGINPGAEYGPAKRWPAENFAAVAREICRRIPNSVWLAFGGPGDSMVCAEIERLANGRVLNLAGRTTLRQLMALLKSCRVVLTNDSGPMHLAAALGTPVVVPFGSTSPELTGPGLPGESRHAVLRSVAPCSPCFLRECPIDFRCMTGITVESAVDSVLLAAGGG
jgi:heptosyltransferase-2